MINYTMYPLSVCIHQFKVTFCIQTNDYICTCSTRYQKRMVCNPSTQPPMDPALLILYHIMCVGEVNKHTFKYI